MGPGSEIGSSTLTSCLEFLTSISPRFLDDIGFDFGKWVGSHGHGHLLYTSVTYLVFEPPTPGLTRCICDKLIWF
jgi:hypothetical protein